MPPHAFLVSGAWKVQSTFETTRFPLTWSLQFVFWKSQHFWAFLRWLYPDQVLRVRQKSLLSPQRAPLASLFGNTVYGELK